jgi:hypothetical protein
MGKIISIKNRNDHFDRLELALANGFQMEPSHKYSHIYFIQQGMVGPIKIGISNNPCKRLANLQTANPHRLRLLFFYKIHPARVYEVEERIHKCFQNDHIDGEWFSPSTNVVNSICNEIESQALRKLDALDLTRGSLLQGLLVSTFDQRPFEAVSMNTKF